MVICYSSNGNLIQILVKIPALRSVERMIKGAERAVVKRQLSASLCYFKKRERLSKLLCAADAKGLKEKRTHSRKGGKSSDLQLQNTSCMDPLLPYRHQPQPCPPGFLNTCLSGFSQLTLLSTQTKLLSVSFLLFSPSHQHFSTLSLTYSLPEYPVVSPPFTTVWQNCL